MAIYPNDPPMQAPLLAGSAVQAGPVMPGASPSGRARPMRGNMAAINGEGHAFTKAELGQYGHTAVPGVIGPAQPIPDQVPYDVKYGPIM